MKYFLDTEFLEGPQKEKFPISLFRKHTPNTIDLISIGIVAEDGREYYAISKDFNLKEAWNRYDLKPNHLYPLGPENVKVYWIRENVLKPIWEELKTREFDIVLNNYELNYFYGAKKYIPVCGNNFTYKDFKRLLLKYGKTNKEITSDILKFCIDEVYVTKIDGKLVGSIDSVRGNPELYAYYADYDWVVFCWLFGKMMDLPKGFPMYCRDLKQIFDQKEDWLRIPTARQNMDLKQHPDFPKQDPSKSHNAIEDARWNKKLYEFLNSL